MEMKGNMVSNFFAHLHTVNTHRLRVCQLCFRCGLYWQGLTHDLSKYSPIEFWAGVKYFQGDRSPIDMERKVKGYSPGWLHHQGRNRHHWQYWMDFEKDQMVVREMPLKYVKEMICDRTAACMIYQKEKYHPSSALEYFQRSIEKKFIHPNTQKLMIRYFSWIAENDLPIAMDMIKKDKGLQN